MVGGSGFFTTFRMTWVWRLVGGGGFGWLNAIQIPAFAGMTVPGGNDGAGAGVTGGLRGPFDKLRVNGGCWIPAFDGQPSLAALLLAAFTLFAACGDNDAGLTRAEVEEIVRAEGEQGRLA